ncbi:hypothetical protein PMAYCL1PPCAC_16381, partial [Pristionchus mayeri]
VGIRGAARAHRLVRAPAHSRTVAQDTIDGICGRRLRGDDSDAGEASVLAHGERDVLRAARACRTALFLRGSMG